MTQIPRARKKTTFASHPFHNAVGISSLSWNAHSTRTLGPGLKGSVPWVSGLWTIIVDSGNRSLANSTLSTQLKDREGKCLEETCI